MQRRAILATVYSKRDTTSRKSLTPTSRNIQESRDSAGISILLESFRSAREARGSGRERGVFSLRKVSGIHYCARSRLVSSSSQQLFQFHAAFFCFKAHCLFLSFSQATYGLQLRSAEKAVDAAIFRIEKKKKRQEVDTRVRDFVWPYTRFV